MRLRLLLIVLAALLLAGPAAAARQNPVIQDCSAHNSLSGSYTVRQLQDALANMPVDVKEYTDCYNIVDRALLRKLGKLGGGDGGGGSFLPGWLLAILVLLLLAGAGYAGVLLRRRRRTLPPADGEAPEQDGAGHRAEHPEPPTQAL